MQMVKPISKVLLIIFQVHLNLIAVNEEVDEDEGYDSIASKNTSEAYNSGMKNVIHYLSINFCDLYQLQNKFGREGKLAKKT